MTDERHDWQRARVGDSAAFGALYRLHRDRVYRQAFRSVAQASDAEDVTALVFLEAWRRRDSVRVVNGSILPWLLVTTNYVGANATRSARRHRAAMAKVLPPEPVGDHADSVLSGLEATDRAATVRAAFARLSPRERDVLTLCVVNEYALTDAAVALGVPVGTVKSRLSRAKARLASLTGRLVPADHDDATPAALGDLS